MAWLVLEWSEVREELAKDGKDTLPVSWIGGQSNSALSPPWLLGCWVWQCISCKYPFLSARSRLISFIPVGVIPSYTNPTSIMSIEEITVTTFLLTSISYTSRIRYQENHYRIYHSGDVLQGLLWRASSLRWYCRWVLVYSSAATRRIWRSLGSCKHLCSSCLIECVHLRCEYPCNS